MIFFKCGLTIVLSLILFACTNTSSRPSNEQATATGVSNISASYQKQYAVALTQMQNKQYKKAYKSFKTLHKKQPNLSGPLANLALIAYQEKDYQAAYDQAKKAVSLNQNLAESHNLIGTSALELGKILEAENAYKKALQLKPTYSSAHYNLALLYDIYIQNIPKAVKHYDAYLSSNSQDTQTKDWVDGLRNSLK